MTFALTFQPEVRWHICAADDAAAAVVAQMARVMGLPPGESLGPTAIREGARRLVVVSNRHDPVQGFPDDVIFRLPTGQPGSEGLFRSQVQVSLALARALLPHGGVLLHGALAERMGQGALLAGSSGSGKTTASRRLPPPWRSWCDDTTLVRPDAQGEWWAHPWPTWSLCLEGGPGGQWNVSAAVPLRAVFSLKQAPIVRLEPLASGAAAARLVQAAEEASPPTWSNLAPAQIRHMRLQRFEWLSMLSRAVPAFTLELNLTGAFWQEIEETLGWNTRCA